MRKPKLSKTNVVLLIFFIITYTVLILLFYTRSIDFNCRSHSLTMSTECVKESYKVWPDQLIAIL